MEFLIGIAPPLLYTTCGIPASLAARPASLTSAERFRIIVSIFSFLK
jgi:hypothetical protein